MWWLHTALAGAPEDLDRLEALIAAVHPSPHRYVDADTLAAAFDEERARVTGDELDTGRAFHRVVALLGDAHALVGLPMTQPGSTTPVHLLPVLTRTVEGAVLVDACAVDVPAGTELLAIDGVAVADVFSTLTALVPVDGRDPVAAARALEWDLPRFHALLYGMRPAHALTLRLPDGAVVEEAVTSVDRAGMGALRASRRTLAWWGTPGAITLTGNVLRIPTFGVADMTAFEAEVDRLLTGFAGPLVVDVRGNEGGLRPNAWAVLDHLIGEPYAEWTGMRAVIRKAPRGFGLRWPYGGTERLRPFHRAADGWRFDGEPLASDPIGDVAGPVTVWVDARTGSAANGFAMVAHAHGATLVGESLGGACDLHRAELPVVWTAPDTGVIVQLPVLELTHVPDPACTPGRGLPPDVPVVPTRADFLAGTDPWLAATPGR